MSINGLSTANSTRTADMAEELFWSVLNSLTDSFPVFITKWRIYPEITRRFKRTINSIDSTTMQLVANCMDWARHRRRKAAAKLHLRLNVGSFLPECIRVCRAKDYDSKKAWGLCAGMKSAEIVVFDKASVNFAHLNNLNNLQK